MLALRCVFFLLLISLLSARGGTPHGQETQDSLDRGWTNPPTNARLRAYWWWLNGNVTKAAITRDLEEMKAKGFGGALICDAGGAEQDGNGRVPHGPTFFTPEWRELYRHTLQEAHRLGLEMSLNILSGWNLGGPVVRADDAAKKLVWSEARISGGSAVALKLPEPQRRDDYYRDVFAVAYRCRPPADTSVFAGISASSEQAEHPAKLVAEGAPESFWVSAGTAAGQGPAREHQEWLQLNFTEPVSANHLTLQGRPGYGPRECELQVSNEGKTFRSVKSFSVPETGTCELDFPSSTGSAFRLVIFSAFDPRYKEQPRNVQVSALRLSGPDGAWPVRAGNRPLQNFQQKAVYSALHFSAPDTTPLFEEFPAVPGEEDTVQVDVVDVSSRLGTDGVLRWQAPPGNWQVLRFGCTIGDHARVSTCSDGWQGYALDVLDAGAFQRYWDAIVEPLIADAGPLAGKTLKYLHTDSWEVEAVNWTPTLRDEFRKRRGYDLLPFAPVLAGRIVDSREKSNRFLADYRKTIGDLAIDHHYRLFRDNAHRHGLEIHPESGGPHAVPIDAQRCLGWDDAPMSEFWAWSWRHRVGDTNRFFVKQPASAAHTYGHRLVLAEGFTTLGPHWQETLWDNLKPSFDHALCEGLNLLVWHAFVCSPAEMGIPGQQYFAGTHFNPNSTWWAKSGAFLSYIDRCQFLLQQGRFVADVCYYYGDHVPNFAQLKRLDPAHLLPGYDYDVITEEAVLTRLTVSEGRLVLPDGMSYRVLVLPERTIISLPVLRKLDKLVRLGATIVGPRPTQASGLQDYPGCDGAVAKLAARMWGSEQPDKGRVVANRTAREVLLNDGIPPDFESRSTAGTDNALAIATHPGVSGVVPAGLDYIHRRIANTDIYFVANGSTDWQQAYCAFRVSGKAPELWDPVTGERRFASAYHEQNGRTSLMLQFAPYGSWFVIFRAPTAAHPPSGPQNWSSFKAVQEISGPWKVDFDPRWGGPSSTQFEQLVSWTSSSEPGVKYYSGTATYHKEFELAAPATEQPSASRNKRLFLNLGVVRELAGVRLNGHDLGVVWAPPFRVDITAAVKPGGNTLEIEVVNFWPNRIIGDQSLSADQRFTKTNIRKLTKDTPLMDSGLLGPVSIEQEN